MAIGDLRIIATEPDSAYGKTCISTAFGDARFLQQRERSAPCPEKNPGSNDIVVAAVFFVANLHAPIAALTPKIFHTTRKAEFEAGHIFERVEENFCQGSEVDVRSRDHSRRSHDVARIATLHHERNPLLDLTLVVGEFHARVQTIFTEAGEALLQIGDVVGSAHEAYMRNRMDK